MDIQKFSIYLFLICVFLSLAACGGPYYFDLYLEPVKADGHRKIAKVLLIEDINSNEAYWSQQIVYRHTPYQVDYFAYKQWAKRPGVIVKDAALHFFRDSGMFRRVIENHSSEEADLILKVNIFAMDLVRENSSWYARLALDFEVIDGRTEKVYITRSFDRKEKVKGKKAGYLPEKLSMILREELIRVAEEINSVLNRVDN